MPTPETVWVTLGPSQFPKELNSANLFNLGVFMHQKLQRL